METALRILHLEDNRIDAEMVRETLARDGIKAEWLCVQRRDAFISALESGAFSLILADYNLPSFDGMSALAVACETCPDVPFIFVSGVIQEEMAIEALKAGATDYVFKSKLSRLGPVVRRAIEEAGARRERREAEEAVKESQRRLTTLMDNLPGMAYRRRDDPQWTVEFISRGCEELTGYAPADFVMNRTLAYADIVLPEDRQLVWDAVHRVLKARTRFMLEYRVTTAAGAVKWVWEQGCGVYGENGDLIALEGFIIDITERKEAEHALHDYAERLRRLSRRLFEVEETERRELARELHDRIGQNVTALTLNLNMVRGALPAECLPKIGTNLDDCETLLYATGQLIRDVMTDLRPPGLDELGLLAALTEHARQVAARAGFSASVTGTEVTPRLPPATEITLFRIAQEALTNVARHARATQVTIALEADSDAVVMTIADNGSGFDPATRPPATEAHLGMISMRERAESIGGRLRVESALGRGTRVNVETPRANHSSFNQPHLPGIEPV